MQHTGLGRLAAICGALAVVWLVSIGVILCVIADLADTRWLIGAIVAQMGVFVSAVGLILVTNTRRDGISGRITPGEPEAAPARLSGPAVSVPIPIMGADGDPYGRRKTDVPVEDIRRVVAALIDKEPDSGRPVWAQGLLDEQSDSDDFDTRATRLPRRDRRADDRRIDSLELEPTETNL